jgi:phage-related minor tail protein
MIQMRTQMTSIFKSFVGNIFGGGFGTGFRYGNQDLGAFLMGNGRAAGGPVAGNTPYIVGERGPELFMPSSAGTIVPNHAMGMSGVTNVTNNYIQAIDVQSFEQRLLGSSNTIWAANQYAQKSLATGRGRT